jgi:hypothetical protein
MEDLKPDNDRRVEGEDVSDVNEEVDNSVVDEEPGPDDADGLPENARRRVPS